MKEQSLCDLLSLISPHSPFTSLWSFKFIRLLNPFLHHNIMASQYHAWQQQQFIGHFELTYYVRQRKSQRQPNSVHFSYNYSCPLALLDLMSKVSEPFQSYRKTHPWPPCHPGHPSRCRQHQWNMRFVWYNGAWLGDTSTRTEKEGLSSSRDILADDSIRTRASLFQPTSAIKW